MTGIVAGVGIATVWLVVPRMVANAAPPAAAEGAPVECVVTLAAKAAQGLTNGAEVTTTFDVTPTVASCVDRRADAQNKVIGATVTIETPGTLTGNCTALKAEVAIQVTWIFATPMGTPVVSTFSVKGGLSGGIPSGEATISGGPLAGWIATPLPTLPDSVTVIGSLLQAACATADGAKEVVAAVTLSFDEASPPIVGP